MNGGLHFVELLEEHDGSLTLVVGDAAGARYEFRNIDWPAEPVLDDRTGLPVWRLELELSAAPWCCRVCTPGIDPSTVTDRDIAAHVERHRDGSCGCDACLGARRWNA